MKEDFLSKEISDYIHSLKESIFEEIKNKIKIYLDMNLLIDFLKVENDISANRPYIKELYAQIIRLIDEKKAVVILSDIHIYEALKPKSDKNLQKLFGMMDKLSEGCCISDSRTIEYNEILFCLRRFFSIENAEYYLYREAYTKPIFLMEDKIPDMKYISKDSNKTIEELQKNFIEYSWKLRPINILRLVTNHDYFDFKKLESDITELLTKNRPIYSHEYSDFFDLLEKEIFGCIDLYKDLLFEYITNYFNNYNIGSNLIADELYNMPIEEKYKKIITLMIKDILDVNQYNVLSSVCIGSGLHALKRFNENHPYSDGDTFDFCHAKRALPYADYFFTEKTLCGMIKDSRLRFDKFFDCKVISKLKEGVIELENL